MGERKVVHFAGVSVHQRGSLANDLEAIQEFTGSRLKGVAEFASDKGNVLDYVAASQVRFSFSFHLSGQ